MEEAWEQETELGLMRTVYDPATGRRVRQACNSRCAWMWGQHLEEQMARFAAHDAELPLSDLGGACRLATDLRAGRGEQVQVYQCFVVRGRALLVMTRETTDYDSLGRLRQVGPGA